MTPDRYIIDVLKTENTKIDEVRKRLNSQVRLLHAMLGINTENGELQDQLKKHLFYGKELDRTNLIEELGDLMWYVALALDEIGVSFEEVWKKNISKLATRYINQEKKVGFSEKNAIERDLESERKSLER